MLNVVSSTRAGDNKTRDEGIFQRYKSNQADFEACGILDKQLDELGQIVGLGQYLEGTGHEEKTTKGITKSNLETLDIDSRIQVLIHKLSVELNQKKHEMKLDNNYIFEYFQKKSE